MTAATSSVGPYELLRPLGEGGMAETFVAVRRGPADFEQRVCLKRILPERAENPLFVELFLDEARLLGRLQCRNIVHVYDFGNAAGTYYMALELVDGLDLAKLLANLRGSGRRISLALALHIFAEVLSALSYAHTLIIDGEPQGIVHRDISPSNILISRNGEVKLTDFGIAKARGRVHQTQTGHVKGKAAYMSPEQIKAGELDGRSDLFSLGIVLFELLTGTHPFDSDTDFAIQLSIIAGKRPALVSLRPDLPLHVVSLLDTLLSTDPNDRPATAQAALALLPAAEPSFALQQKLAALVDKRHEGTTEDATLASVPRPAAPTAEEWARAVQSERPAAMPSAPAITPLATAAGAQRRFNGAWLVVPLLLLVVSGVAYAWFARTAKGPPSLPSLTAIAGEAPADAPSRDARDSKSRVGSDPAPAVEALISPAKASPRPPARPVEVVVSPPKSEPAPALRSTPEVISPAKSDAPPKTQPLDALISPAKSAPTAKPEPVESVVSPRKGATRKDEPLDVVISPRKKP